MKLFKSFIFAGVCALSLTSCSDWLDINTDPNSPTAESVEYQTLLPWCQFYMSHDYLNVRLEKALNFSLMKNDFRVLQEEITFYERVNGKAVHGMEQWKNLTDKREYYRQVFGQPE